MGHLGTRSSQPRGPALCRHRSAVGMVGRGWGAAPGGLHLCPDTSAPPTTTQDWLVAPPPPWGWLAETVGQDLGLPLCMAGPEGEQKLG